ncbi:MAG TPA: DUF4097 family beta strand repeat-containing protein [Candidatus Angelobacter sp.]
MSAPNPAPAYRPERPRSIFGPIMLVAIGITLLLCTTGVLSWRSFWLGFARYWPAVLILWGVAKLAEYMWAKQRGYRPPRLGAGSIVFLVFFILFGTVVTKASGVNWSGIRDGIVDDTGWDGFDWMGAGYDFNYDSAQSLQGATQIKVLVDRGDISVTPSADDQAHLVVHKTLRGDSQSDADRLDTSTQAKFQQQGTLWLMDLTGGDYQRGRFNLDLQLPRTAALSVMTRVGNITVSGRKGSLEASSDHGDVNADQVTGDLSVRLKHGDVTAKNVTGNVTVDGTVSDSNISDVGGTVTLTGTYWGDMQLARIAKQVHFISSRTDLQFAKLDGEFNMQPDELRANAIAGPFKLSTRSKSVNLEDVSGDVHIDNQNGSVEMRPKAPVGNIDVTNVRGEIDLTMPANAGFQLDAQSIAGEIQSDFNVSVDNSGNNATARGTVGKGGAAVRLKADHGTIQLRKQQ